MPQSIILNIFIHNSSYPEVVRHVVKSDGIIGLFGRGLKTRIMANALNVSIYISSMKRYSLIAVYYHGNLTIYLTYMIFFYLIQSMLFATLWKYIMERQEKARQHS